jgi:hypothetical protein
LNGDSIDSDYVLPSCGYQAAGSDPHEFHQEHNLSLTQNHAGQTSGEQQGPPQKPPEGQEPAPGNEKQGPPAPDNKEEQQSDTIVDVVHGGISRTIQGTATWMDSFFGDRRYQAELNESYIRFRYNIFLEDGTPMDMDPEFQLRVILPQLREKTRLVITGTPARDRNQVSALETDPEQEQLSYYQERNFTAGVEQTIRESLKDSFLLRAGLRFHSGRPGLLIGPRYRILIPLDSWNLRFVEEFLWKSGTGWVSRTTTDLERPLPHGLFFRASNEWLWQEPIPGFVYVFVFIVGQPLKHDRALEYEWVNAFETRPDHVLTEVALRVRYRQQFLRDWLFFEVAPQYRFPRDRSFEATPGILFRLDLMLGHYL